MADQINITVTDTIPPDNIATIDKDGKVGNAVSKDQLQVELNDFKGYVQDMIVSDFKGNLAPTDPAPTEDGSYKPTISSDDPNPSNPSDYGTLYTNAGNLRAKKGFSTLFYKKGSSWTKSDEEMPQAQKNIPKFENLTFPALENTQTEYHDNFWKVKAGMIATVVDLPSMDVNSKWQVLGLTLDSSFKKYINPTLEVGAIALNTGSPANSDTRGRTSSFLDISFASQLELIGDMSLQNIFYYTETNTHISGSSQVINGKTFVPTIPANAKKFKLSLYHTTNTQVVTQPELNALILNCYSTETGTIKQVADNANNSVKVTNDYNQLQINISQGFSVGLGGINVNDGTDANNNVRIRTGRIPVKNGSHSISNMSGFKVSRLAKYKDGTYKGYEVVSEFVVDTNVYNEIRVVWEKNINTDIITSAEAAAFTYVVINNDINKLIGLLDLVNRNNDHLSTWFTGGVLSSMGDSIDYGYTPRNYPGFPGQIDSYLKKASSLLGMSWDNKAISGSTLGRVTASDSVTRNPMVDRFNTMATNARVITFKGGTNDLRYISNLGVMTDRIPETYYGALHILIQGLLNKYVYSQNLVLAKDILIVGITPLKIYPDSIYGGKTMIDYVNAMKEVCSYYGMPCFDAYNLSGLTPGEFRTLQGTEPGYTDMYNPLITDGVHPTTEGHSVFAERFAGFLKTLVH
ncbi:SGNH/GDSL hydrolase family protein [Chryseobacterium sp.]|uniref:SGNH/GDSL hydrolase family protein n=1 Tax=Chryseobacterium sp. TaxID=1871047 RepID=UPI0024E26C85|nr:SGNH/GDSL hydrolase family protein [Chryseobacterium sp.]